MPNNGPDESPTIKRYNLALPEELYNEVYRIAVQRQTTVVDILRKFIKLGLIAARLEDTPGAALIIREGTNEKEIILI